MGVALENLAMAEKKWLKAVPECLRLGATVLETLAHRDKEQRGPYEIGQGGKGDLKKEPNANLKCSPKLKCSGRVRNCTSAVSFDKFCPNKNNDPAQNSVIPLRCLYNRTSRI